MQDSFSVLPCRSTCICPILLLLPLLFIFTLRLRCLVCSSRCSLYVFALLTHCFQVLLVFVIATQSLPPPPPFTLRLCSPDSLFQLLVFVFASQSCTSRSYCLSCSFPTFFNRPLALFRRRYSLSSSVSQHPCTCLG